MANTIGYKLVANATPTSDKAPYTGMAIPVGSLAYDNILAEMIKSGARLTQATAQFLLTALYEYAADTIAEKVVRINLGDVSIYPMIGGSFASEDAAFDAAKNTLYVGASLSQDVNDAVAAITPTYAGEENAAAVKLDSEMDIDSQTFKVVDGGKAFRLAGRNLTVPDAEGESIALYSKDGTVKVSDIEVSENDGGQLLTCRLSGSAEVAKGSYKIVVKERGLDPTAPLATLSIAVTLVSAYEPVPTFTNATSPGQPDGTIQSLATVVLTGTNLRALQAGERLAYAGSDDDFTEIVVSEDGKTMTARAGDYDAGTGKVVLYAADGSTITEIAVTVVAA